jgi:hypothetical protein
LDDDGDLLWIAGIAPVIAAVHWKCFSGYTGIDGKNIAFSLPDPNGVYDDIHVEETQDRIFNKARGERRR